MSRLEAVLFDLDGTLTDSRLGILRSARYAFERLSAAKGRAFPLPDDAELGWMIGPPLRDSFAKLVGRENVETLMGFYLERYSPIGAFENYGLRRHPGRARRLARRSGRAFSSRHRRTSTTRGAFSNISTSPRTSRASMARETTADTPTSPSSSPSC